MSFLSFLGPFAPTPATECDIEDLASLLKAVLPTFIATVDKTRQGLPEPDLSETRSRPTTARADAIRTFYHELFATLTNLQVVLTLWNPSEIVQSSSADEVLMRSKLETALNGLDGCFLSRKAEMVSSAFKRLGIEHTGDSSFWKLRTLKSSKRMPSRDEDMPEDYLEDISLVIRMDSKRSDKRNKLLHDIQAAVAFFHQLELFEGASYQPCPLHYSSYPMRYVTSLSKSLFAVVQSSWTCQCDGSTLHVSRRARLNLTQHQRFDTAPVRGSQVSEKEHCFRVLFPTAAREIEWQDTDITIDTREHLRDAGQYSVNNDLCGVIRSVKTRLRPRMVVWKKELWRISDGIEERSSTLTQVKDAEFVTLKELLSQRITRNGRSSDRSRSLRDTTWNPKDRLILSFILATSLLHFFSGPRLGADLSSDSICFIRTSHGAKVNITRPYLTVSCAPFSLPYSQSAKWRNQPHRFPDILALGILLLEIERGAPIELDEFQDPCVVAIDELNKWTKSSPSTERRTVPEGLYHAMNACIRPSEYTLHRLDKTCPNLFEVRSFIFQRILYPLDQALSTAYEVQSHMLLTDAARSRPAVEETGFFDGEEDHPKDTYQQHAAQEWMDNLEGSVRALVHECQERCERHFRRDKAGLKSTRVRVAVLDTGLQLPGALQSVYEDDERILDKQSKSFVQEGAAEDPTTCWRLDHDGHGSLVGQIVLRCAPCADLHIAKVFRTRQDLMNPALATQVHKRIADAIDQATNDWEADVIIMSFGFDQPIRLIREAIDRASKRRKAPLFFAATRNNGAHQDIAWPANDMQVFGISSTTPEGAASTFNSRETEGAKPILYAFGQGVPVVVAAPEDPVRSVDKYVSGTSYATPVAAALCASLLGCVRMLLSMCSPGDRARFAHVPEDLQSVRGMLRVLLCRMQRAHGDGQESILPWDFLRPEMAEGTTLLREVDEVINGKGAS